jgi:hypothetical protein
LGFVVVVVHGGTAGDPGEGHEVKDDGMGTTRGGSGGGGGGVGWHLVVVGCVAFFLVQE